MLGWIEWDPSAVMFSLPFFHVSLTWYGALFSLSFFVGFYLFISLLERYQALFPSFLETDFNFDACLEYPDHPLLLEIKKKIGKVLKCSMLGVNGLLEDSLLRGKLEIFAKEPTRKEKRWLAFVRQRKGMQEEKRLYSRLLLERLFPTIFFPLSARVRRIADSLLLYVVIGTIIGARLGHFLFYEPWSLFVDDPFMIFRIWEGGLASHGGILGVVIALLLFYRRKGRFYPHISLMRWLDLLAVPTMFVCSMIRVGNFFNQEILGRVTDRPWGVIFLHPADGSMPMPRHPVQIYECIVYFFVFLTGWYLAKRYLHCWRGGKIVGYCFILSFVFRFFVESLKGELSLLLAGKETWLLMGQYLSLPMIALGLILYFWERATPR